jgi:hypothetical protein
MSSYQNIFAASNCSLISGLIPPGVKKFINAFMSGNLLRNPLGTVFGLLGEQMGTLIEGLGVLNALPNTNLRELNDKLGKLNTDLQKFKKHTDILSGLIRDPDQGYATLDQIIGVMSAYNSMKDLLKDPGARLEDNFSQAFSSLNPRFVGPFFENFSANTNEIERLLGEISIITDANGIQTVSGPIDELAKLADNVGDLSSSIEGFIEGDKATYLAAAAVLADYALANGLVSSMLSDPCFGGQVITNLITNSEARNDLTSIASSNGIDIQNSPVDFANLASLIQNRTL